MTNRRLIVQPNRRPKRGRPKKSREEGDEESHEEMNAIQRKEIPMICLPVLLVLALCAPAQENPASIRFEQSIYVVAKRIDNSNLDLSVEAKARSEFEKRKKFTVAKSSANADFVFLILTEYDSYSGAVLTGNPSSITGAGASYNYVKGITAVVVSAKDYSEYKDNIEKLRETSVWQGSAKAGMREASAPNIVKSFHEHVGKRQGSAK